MTTTSYTDVYKRGTGYNQLLELPGMPLKINKFTEKARRTLNKVKSNDSVVLYPIVNERIAQLNIRSVSLYSGN